MPETESNVMASESEGLSAIKVKHLTEEGDVQTFGRTLLAVPTKSSNNINVMLTWLDPRHKLSLFAI